MALGLVVVAWLALSVFTAVGAWHRHGGHRRLLAVACGMAFPITWVAWYIIDSRTPAKSAARVPGYGRP